MHSSKTNMKGTMRDGDFAAKLKNAGAGIGVDIIGIEKSDFLKTGGILLILRIWSTQNSQKSTLSSPNL
ncbi:MAG: hypothetical protein KDA77_14680 [Planctomycetaceae bacterium]|nr:hypothetical protein [Planctomycetaceae bacterium]